MHATETELVTPARPTRWWSAIALIAVILVYVALMNARSPSPLGTEGPMIGRRLAYLELQGLTGTAANVSLADLNGRVTLINFWGTWCPPCIRELPQIERLGEQFAAQPDFRLLAVSCGQGADEDLSALRTETARFMNARGANRTGELPTYSDHHASTRQAMSLVLGTPLAYPTTLLLDRQGTIRGFWQGFDPRAADEMERVIEKLLNSAD